MNANHIRTERLETKCGLPQEGKNWIQLHGVKWCRLRLVDRHLGEIFRAIVFFLGFLTLHLLTHNWLKPLSV